MLMRHMRGMCCRWPKGTLLERLGHAERAPPRQELFEELLKLWQEIYYIPGIYCRRWAPLSFTPIRELIAAATGTILVPHSGPSSWRNSLTARIPQSFVPDHGLNM